MVHASGPRLSDAGGEVSDVVFELKESLARSLDLEIGYGSYELIRGAVRLTDRNFLGRGRTFTAEIIGSVRGAGVDLAIRYPYILGERNVLELETGYLFREEPSFDLQSFHASLLVKREISRIWSARGGYSFRDEEATNVKVPIDEEAEGFIRTAGLVFGAACPRDSSFLPTTGALLQASMLWSSPALGADLDFFERRTAKVVVTACAGCFMTLKHNYPIYAGKLGFELYHLTQFIDRLIKDKKLVLRNPLPKKIAYHDPCHIGRHHGIFEEPRRILKAFPQSTFLEHPHNRYDSQCCGAGGGYKIQFNERAENIASRRVEEARSVGAEMLVSSCPFCVTNLTGGVKVSGAKMEVAELVSLVARLGPEMSLAPVLK